MIFKEPDNKMKINFLIHRIHHLWKRVADQKMLALGLDQETISCGRILRFLYFQPDDADVYQKTIEKSTGFTKSTVSNLLSILESRGYIKRMAIREDARLKKIVLTEKGQIANRKMTEAFDYADSCFTGSFTEGEQEALVGMLSRINDNISKLEEEPGT